MSLSAANLTVSREASQSADLPAKTSEKPNPPTEADAPKRSPENAQKIIENPSKEAENPPKKPQKTPETPTEKPAETPKIEEPKEKAQTKQEEPKKEDESTRFAVLARREAKLVKEAQALKAEKTRLEGLAKAQAEEKAALEKTRAEEEAAWRANPLQALEKKGTSYKDLTDRILNDGKPSPEEIAARVAREAIEAENKKRTESERAEAEKAKVEAEKNLEAARTDWKEQLKDFIKSDSEKFELVNLYEGLAIDIAQQLVEQSFEKTKKILSNDEAATLVENYLFEEIQKGTKTKKFKAKAEPQPEGDKKLPEDAPSPEKAQLRPITNRWSPSARPKSTLTWEERLERARRV